MLEQTYIVGGLMIFAAYSGGLILLGYLLGERNR